MVSIQPNTEATAFEACKSLDHLMRREKVAAGTRYIAPEKIIERDSTNTVATRDSVVQLACRLLFLSIIIAAVDTHGGPFRKRDGNSD
jgi:hypothetical protein